MAQPENYKELVNKLVKETKFSFMECKTALNLRNWDCKKALAILNKKKHGRL